MNLFVGQTEKDINFNLGPPTRITTDGDSGKVYVYENISYNTFGITPNLARTNTEVRYIHLYINQSGLVYAWRTNYPDIIEKKKSAKQTNQIIAGCIGAGALVLILGALFGS